MSKLKTRVQPVQPQQLIWLKGELSYCKMMYHRSSIIASILIFCFMICHINASVGDRSQFFINCLRGCMSKNCSDDGLTFQPSLTVPKQNYFNKILYWRCSDECSYNCMWRTTNAFLARNWSVPQFYGKWPFERWLGIQEPASVVFSILNFFSHWWMICQFRKDVRNDSPMFYVWHIFCAICLNGWIWSAIFHTRDFPFTELCDYSFAYSIVLSAFTVMVLRMLHQTSHFIKIAFSIFSLFYFINHFAHLSVGSFDYNFNMKANVATGVLSGIGWLIWYMMQRKKRKYAWKMLAFQLLAACSLLLELNDFSPIFWTFDAHSLWHLSTVPLTFLLYSFAIDDCKSLRREKFEAVDEKEKLI